MSLGGGVGTESEVEDNCENGGGEKKSVVAKTVSGVGFEIGFVVVVGAKVGLRVAVTTVVGEGLGVEVGGLDVDDGDREGTTVETGVDITTVADKEFWASA